MQPMAQPPPNQIPDTTETELWVMRTTLKELCRRAIDLQVADADVRISPADRALTRWPVMAWQSDDGCVVAIFKVGEHAYRCPFFYKPHNQMGAGRLEYDDLTECTVALPQAQTDYAAEERGDPTRALGRGSRQSGRSGAEPNHQHI